MKKEKVISAAVAFMLFFVMCAMNVSAEDTTFKLTVGNENVNVEKDTLTGEVDYSNLNVNVIKRVGEEKEIVYSGALSGYKDGKYSDIDFGELQIVIVYNKDNPEDTVYIVPAEETAAVASSEIDSMSLVDMQVENTGEVQNAIADEFYHITADASLVYNDVYHESILLPGNTLGVPVTVTNTGTEDKEIESYIAKYDLNGKLIGMNKGDIITAPANQTVSANLSESFTTDEICAVKVFMWEKSTMRPITDGILLVMQNLDYYSDTYSNSVIIGLDKRLCGVLNTDTDVDIVKYTPSADGLYAIRMNADEGVECGLYDSSLTLLESVSVIDDYLLYSLTANQDYYVRFNGSENNAYLINPAQPSDIVTVLKNAGISDNLSDSIDFNIYEFTPSADGDYIITAVDGYDVKADLYNSDYEKLSSSAVGDDDVSFRISTSMEADKKYYIIISTKSDKESASYSLYVEEPFALISVE